MCASSTCLSYPHLRQGLSLKCFSQLLAKFLMCELTHDGCFPLTDKRFLYSPMVLSLCPLALYSKKCVSHRVCLYDQTGALHSKQVLVSFLFGVLLFSFAAHDLEQYFGFVVSLLQW